MKKMRMIFTMFLALLASQVIAKSPGDFDLKSLILSSDAILTGQITSDSNINSGIKRVELMLEAGIDDSSNARNLLATNNQMQLDLPSSMFRGSQVGSTVLFFALKKNDHWKVLNPESALFFVDSKGLLTSPFGDRIVKLTANEIRYEQFETKPNRGAPQAIIVDENGAEKLLDNTYPPDLINYDFITLEDFLELYKDLKSKM